MSKQLVRLCYEFEFDPSKLWSNKSQFDNALVKFFSSHDIEIEPVTYIGSPGTSLFRLEKQEAPKPETNLNKRKPVVIKNKR